MELSGCRKGQTHKLPSQRCEVRIRLSSCFLGHPAPTFPPAHRRRRHRHQYRHRRRSQRYHVRQSRVRGSPKAAAEAAPEGRGGRLRVPQGCHEPAKRCRPGPRGGRGASGGHGYRCGDKYQRRHRRRGWIVPQRHAVMACASYLFRSNVRMKYFPNCTNLPYTVYFSCGRYFSIRTVPQLYELWVSFGVGLE